jgi:hypothetical protein
MGNDGSIHQFGGFIRRAAASSNNTLVWEGEDHAAPQLCVIFYREIKTSYE